MLTRFKQFLASLQAANDKTKQRWVIGASAVAMFFVVLLWLVYLTLTLPSLPNSEIADDSTSAAVSTETAAPAEPTFFSTFSRGISILVKQTEAGLASFAGRMAESVTTLKKGIEKKNVIEVKGTESATSTATASVTTSTDGVTTTSTPQ